MPTLTAELDTERARVRITLAGYTDGPTSISRWSVETGESLPVRSADPIEVIDGTAVAYDYEVPFDKAVYYQTSDGTLSGTVSLPGLSAWIKVPAQPYLNRPVHLEEISELSYAARQSTFNVVGRRDPIVVADVRASMSGALVFVTWTYDEANALDELFRDVVSAYVQIPGSRFNSQYLAIRDVTCTPLRGQTIARWTVEFQAIDRPPGGAVGDLTATWQQLIDTYPTWQDVIDGETTWLDVLSGIGI